MNLLLPIKELIIYVYNKNLILINILDLSLSLVLTIIFFNINNIRVEYIFNKKDIKTNKKDIKIKGININNFFISTFYLINSIFLLLYFSTSALTLLIF